MRFATQFKHTVRFANPLRLYGPLPPDIQNRLAYMPMPGIGRPRKTFSWMTYDRMYGMPFTDINAATSYPIQRNCMRFKLEDLWFCGPKDYKTYLERLYGPEYMIPDRNWSKTGLRSNCGSSPPLLPC